MSLTLGRGLFMVLIFGTASLVYRYIVSRNRGKCSRDELINEVLTFLDSAPTHTEQYSSRPQLHPSTERILYYLNLSRCSVDIYMEIITSLDAACQLMDLHRRGIKLRIIVDPDMAYAPASVIKLLEKQGIDVCLSTMDSTVRNFCLVDTCDENILPSPKPVPFIIFGSPPWTIEAFSGDNNEIVLVTSRVAFVNVFKEEFERIYTAAI